MLKANQTNLTASSRSIKNLVILLSVIVKYPFFCCSIKNGITDPLEPITLPYLTIVNFVILSLEYSDSAANNLSAANFVAPYKFIGFEALSVDKLTTLFIFYVYMPL